MSNDHFLKSMAGRTGDVGGGVGREPEAVAPAKGGSIQVELPGRGVISLESGADPMLLRTLLDSPRQ